MTLAHTDTKSACTAQDIEVTGGQIINEPCNCSPGGTFIARAQFTVTNNNNSRRKCVTLHLWSGGTLGGRIVFAGTPADLVAARPTLTGERLAADVGA